MADSEQPNESESTERVRRYRRKKPHVALQVLGNRWLVKGSFFLLFVMGCIQLLAFARRMEQLAPQLFSDQNKLWAAAGWLQFGSPAMSGVPAPTDRPEVVAGILPVGHFTSFFAWVKGGGWDYLLPAGLVIIIGALILSVFFKRGFCGWICPVGTFMEVFSALGRKLFGRNIKLPKWVDIPARVLRYLIAFFFFFWLASVSIEEATGFRTLPYMFIADVKIIRSFLTPPFIAAFAAAALLTVFFSSVWCRYLCPLGGLYGPLSIFSPAAITRDEHLCIDCGKCAAACHALLPVDEEIVVRSPECDGCMDCVHVCPVKDAVEMKVASRWTIPAWAWPVLVAGAWLTIWAIAKVTGNWDTTIPESTFAFALATVGESGKLDGAALLQIVKMLFFG